MPNIFIGYRRDDSPASVRLLYERLRAWFPSDNVFMDVEEIPLGAQWKDVLRARVDACDVLLAVIGRGWLGATDSAGNRRLDNPEDFVRWEIAEALRRGKRVIPVLVDGAALPGAEQLPADIAALAGSQAQPISHGNFEADVQTLAAKLAGKDIRDVLDHLRQVLRMGKASVVVGAVVAVVVLSFGWAKLFDLLGLDTRTASATMLIGDVLFEVPLSEKLAIVAIHPQEDEETRLSPARRHNYAQLIELAATQGAAAIAFDITLETPSEFDPELIGAVRAARSLGTVVVFGFKNLRARKPVAPPGLAEAGAVFGLTCIGQKLGEATLATLAMRAGNELYGSLALHAALRPTELVSLPPNSTELEIRGAPGQEPWVPYSFREVIEQPDADCPARLPGSDMARLIIRLSHRERLRDPVRYFSMEDVLASTGDTGQRFKGKIVLVGVELALDMLETRMDVDGARYGFEFHADAINALITGTIIRPMGLLAQWLLALAMIAVAVAYRLWRLGRSQRWNALVLACICILYFGAAVFLYAKLALLVDGLYHLAAFVLTWWALSALERRWVHATV